MGDATPSKGDATPSKYEPFTDYYLHPSEGSQLVICPVLLTVDNYEEWSRSIRNNLRSKSKLGFVDGTISKPAATSPDYRQWGIVNSTLVAWIFNTIDSSIRSTIIIPDDAKILWDDLRDRYSLGNGPRILEIKNAIADCKQRGRSVAIYYGELNKLQNLLSSYLKLPACTCSAAAEYARMHETAMLHQFCIGLDSQKFGSVVSTLLMSDPLPTMNAAYAKIIADERKQSVSAAQEATSATSVGFSATGSASGRSSDRLECSHCKRVGHDKDHCYSLHGFPDGGRGGRSGRGGRGGRGGRSTGKGRGDFAGSVGSTARGANEQVSDSDRGSVPTLSDTQWKELLAALKGSKSDKFPYLNSLPDEKRALWEAYFASPPVWEDANDDDTPPTAGTAAHPRSPASNRSQVADSTAASPPLRQLPAATAASPRHPAPNRGPTAAPPAAPTSLLRVPAATATDPQPAAPNCSPTAVPTAASPARVCDAAPSSSVLLSEGPSPPLGQPGLGPSDTSSVGDGGNTTGLSELRGSSSTGDRRSDREKRPPSWHRHYVINTILRGVYSGDAKGGGAKVVVVVCDEGSEGEGGGVRWVGGGMHMVLKKEREW
ncbi:hypothetical protein BVRB_4g078970 [Beta vulgaris subsp. vulgaris]|nr:hypothetical protein BVRB_4g078970 [Beta vulgaris subsp. vulgaris]